MTTEETKVLVNKAVAVIERKIENGKQSGMKSVSVRPTTGMYMDDKVYFRFGYNDEIFDRAECSDAKMFFRLLREELVRRGYSVEVDDVYRSNVWWMPAFTKVTKVTYIEGPCKEFTALSKYLDKFGKFKLGATDIYNVGMFGKRGVLDMERGERNYLCHRPKKCSEILGFLRDKRGAKDKLSVSLSQEEYCEDRDISMRLETECYGSLESLLKIRITTPGGKEKVNETFYL